jgi:SWI/SNF-related matrix-associated actin-dependent regulator 1 of chromatin subfamily A
MMEMGFKVALCDEAHALKGRESKRSLTLVPFLESIKRIVLISGTPLLSRPCELYNLVKILRPDVFKQINVKFILYYRFWRKIL